jgi:hypothetical protein
MSLAFPNFLFKSLESSKPSNPVNEANEAKGRGVAHEL